MDFIFGCLMAALVFSAGKYKGKKELKRENETLKEIIMSTR